jgi:hypothetical protein
MGREIVVEIPTLHSDQVKAYETITRNRFSAIRCGRRWGKTALLATLAADDALNGKRVGYFAPDYKRLSETYSEIERILAPIKKSSSQTQGLIRTINDGLVEFWTLGDESAGRSRKYHTGLIDEASFTKTPAMWNIWRKAIKPTLLDYRGRCIVASNTSGSDPDNFFWKITNEPEHGFVEYWAPSRNNPYLPADEIETLRKSEHPLVFQQEYEAEWVNWLGVAFFALESLLVNGKAAPMPTICDGVLVVLDTAVKTGSENDGTAVIYFAINRYLPGPKLTILDWDIQQIEGSLLEAWMPSVFQRLEELAKMCRARMGSLGAWIEDKSSGMILLQQAARHSWQSHAIDTALTAKGKDERALSVSGYVYRGDVKLSEYAHDKVSTYKGATRNHLISQVSGFRMGDKDAAKRADDLLDCFTYGISISIGNSDGW